MNSTTLRDSAIGSVALIAAIYLITLVLIQERAFWITDNANKFLQVEALLASGYTDYAIPWPGAGIDPDFRYNPLPDPWLLMDPLPVEACLVSPLVWLA